MQQGSRGAKRDPSSGGIRLRIVPILLAVAALVLVAAAPALATTFTVTATNYQWSPTPLDVNVGDAVTYANGGGFHSFVSDAGQGSCSLPCTLSYSAAGNYPYHCGVHGTAMSGVVVVGTRPTVVISSPADGASVAGQIVVRGTASSANGGLASVRVDAGAITLDATLDMPNATSSAWRAALDTARIANGPLAMVATARDAAGLEGNASVSVTIANPMTRDLAISGFRTLDGATSTPKLVFTATNDGNTETGAWDLVAQYAYKGAWRTFLGATEPSLAARANASLTLSWDASPLQHVGSFSVRVIADPDGKIAETNESNNEGDGVAWWYASQLPGLDPSDP